MIYGYALKELPEPGLLEMKEISFCVSATVLREIAAFLEEAAIKMESGFFENCSHLHICTVKPNWIRQHPNKDIIVMPPLS
jgi:hypothetical protein